MKKIHFKNILLLLPLPLCSIGCMDALLPYWNFDTPMSKELTQKYHDCYDKSRYLFHGGEYIKGSTPNFERKWQVDCVAKKEGKEPRYEDVYRDEVNKAKNKYKIENGSLKRTQ